MKGMQLAAAGIVALGAATICAGSAEAQAATIASPFHAGQWAVEGYAAGSTGGVMRFFTPRTALVLTLSAYHRSTKSDDAGSSLLSDKSTVFDATLGFRHHVMLPARVVGTVGAGAVGGTVQQKQEYVGVISPSSYHSSYYGAFADVGAQYMVADHFAVGLAYRFLARHIKNDVSQQAGAEFQTAILPVRATLYF